MLRLLPVENTLVYFDQRNLNTTNLDDSKEDQETKCDYNETVRLDRLHRKLSIEDVNTH